MVAHNVYRKAESVQWQSLDDGAVLLELDSGHYYTLNDVAQRIWELLDGAHSLEAIMAIVLQEFDVTGELLERDMTELVERLIADKLIILV